MVDGVIGVIMVTVPLLVEEVIRKDTELVLTLHQQTEEMIATDLTLTLPTAMSTSAQVILLLLYVYYYAYI